MRWLLAHAAEEARPRADVELAPAPRDERRSEAPPLARVDHAALDPDVADHELLEVLEDVHLDRVPRAHVLAELAIDGIPRATHPALKESAQRRQILVQAFA